MLLYQEKYPDILEIILPLLVIGPKINIGGLTGLTDVTGYSNLYVSININVSKHKLNDSSGSSYWDASSVGLAIGVADSTTKVLNSYVEGNINITLTDEKSRLGYGYYYVNAENSYVNSTSKIISNASWQKQLGDGIFLSGSNYEVINYNKQFMDITGNKPKLIKEKIAKIF